MCVGTILAMLAPNVFGTHDRAAPAGGLRSYLSNHLSNHARNAHPRQFGPALGLVTAVSGGVGGADQFLGGLFSDHWGFRSIFLFILIVGIAAIILSIAYVPESTAATPAGWTGQARRRSPRR